MEKCKLHKGGPCFLGTSSCSLMRQEKQPLAGEAEDTGSIILLLDPRLLTYHL